MIDFVINGDELEAMSGLPHIQQLTYLRGIRPYMDVKTGIVGIKRRISHQSISEQLYVEPHQGIKSQSFSRDQVRRAVSGLDRAGLVEVQSEGMHLILKCLLASPHYSAQNKAAINPPQKATIKPPVTDQLNTGFSGVEAEKGDIGTPSKAAIPLYKDNYYIYLLAQFEQFWSLYPEKKSKNNAQAAFEQLNPSTELFQQIMLALQQQLQHRSQLKAQGTWVPPWKYPANWLAKRSWEDELFMDALQENTHAKHEKNTRPNNTRADLFCPPCDEEEPRADNVISFQRYQ
ncbi:TPA: hypothetical protein RGN03_002237 [Legionella pneumophila]|nr:hypothetical protein [Legionella pneumophila]HAU4041825.1 hypothetical protein [Legionella pneumophila]HAU4054639.1 hypothetical protein [Legionella pneumophila]HDU8241972.1 hypothetical protein [Legionella pneumophila]HDU8251512.1 hypothetical protein [Legionella pneumophila]